MPKRNLQNMNKFEIIQKLQKLGFPKTEYWLVTGSAMVLYGVKEETHDIDLGCSKKLADRLEAEGYLPERMADGSRKFVIGSDIEIFEEWLFDHVEYVDEIPAISLKGLIMMKESLGREKDKKDIAAIKEFMKHQNRA